MAEFGSTENILWFWAVLFITVPPVLRFRQNFLVPLLATLLSFGFYTQSFWMPDFYILTDWLGILLICSLIGLFYFTCGFFIHYFVLRAKSVRLRKHGALSPLLKAWLSGVKYIVKDDFVAEIRRLRMFEVTWEDAIGSIAADGSLIITDGVEREPEILNEVRIAKPDKAYGVARQRIEKKERS